MSQFVIYETGQDPIEVNRDEASRAISLCRVASYAQGVVEIREIVNNPETKEREEITIFRSDKDNQDER